MELIRAEIRAFGCLRNEEIRFTPGINIRSGENESGKTTLVSFLVSMLFGMERGRGRRARTDTYSTYLPKGDEATYGGSLWIREKGREYRIQRSFLGKGSLTLECPAEARRYENPEEMLQNLLSGVTLRTFLSVCCILQAEAALGEDPMEELRLLFTQLRETGSREMNLREAKKFLEAEKKELTQRRPKNLAERFSALTERKRRMEAERDLWEKDLASILEEEKEKSLRLEALGEEERREKRDTARRTETLPQKRRGSAGLFVLFAVFLLSLSGLLYLLIQGKKVLPLMVALLVFGFVIALVIFLRPEDEQRREDTGEGGFSAPESLKRREDERREKEGASLRESLTLLRERKQRVLWEEEHARKREEEISASEDLLQAEAEEDAYCKTHLEALALAETHLLRAAEEQVRESGKTWLLRTGENLAALTGGRYQSIRAHGGDFFLRRGDDTVSLEELSRGTLHQLYLAMRLSSYEMLCRKIVLPLILDEPFAFYDDTRMRRALDLLSERQVQSLILTSQGREEAWLLGEDEP